MATIPPREREEWKLLVEGAIKHQFTNFVLQLKINHAEKNIKAGKQTADNAADELYSLCCKYKLAVQKDLQTIFKTW